MPSVLITGANGFIGSHLCDAFTHRGYQVYGLVRSTSDLKFLKDSNVRLVYGDLRDIGSIELPDSVEVIVHAAASVSDYASMEECRTNILDITINLTDWSRQRCKGLKKFVYISSALTIGYCADDISEDSPGRSVDYLPYIHMKKKTETFLMERFRQTGFPVVIMRPGDVYGPRDRTSCEIMLRGAERSQLVVVGKGDKKFGFCYPDNLCRAVLAAAEKPGTEGRAYTVTNSVFPTWRAFFSALREGVGRPQRIYVPVSLALAVVLFLGLLRRLFPGFKPPINYYRIRRITCQTTYDLSKTIRELDYDPDNDYESQFNAIVEWYKRDREERRS
ncbi:MAG: NAD(P)-dependent oxidoreductase [Spirochaetales bacterium]|nr:NAD(P)-dependent oxidoreductase [Spirochaetales bacterium]